MKPNETICPSCNGAGYTPNSGEEEICRRCLGTGIIVKKEKENKTDNEVVKHSPTVDEWIEEQQRKRGIIK